MKKTHGRIREKATGIVRESTGVTAQIEVRVSPGVKLGAAAQGLAWPQPMRAFSGMMDEDNGELVKALKLAQIAEQGCDLAGSVLVDTVQSDEGIQQQQRRSKLGDGFGEPALVDGGIQA